MLTPLLVTFLTFSPIATHRGDPPDFRRDVRPLLADRCFACHGPDANTRRADLRLDVEEDAKRERRSGRAIDVREPAASLLVDRIATGDPARRMPPPSFGKELTNEERDVLRAWVRSGAPYAGHWAFQPPRSPNVPEAIEPSARNPVDAFLDERLAREEITPLGEAERAIQARRVAIALTGIAPTPDELDRFLADERDGALERLVDRLLASPRHGEHLARFWLDLARYADTNGYQYDTHRDQWGWRDWVIDAFNDGMPFDRFTRDQMAGDLLEEKPGRATVATGFHRNHPITIEGGVIDEEYRTEYVLDRVNVTSTVWLGLTMNCARCHDHKYDPLTMRDHYALAAYFNETDERGLNPKDRPAPPYVDVPTRRQALERDRIEDRLATVEHTYRAWLEATHADRERFARERRALATSTWRVVPLDIESPGGETFTPLDDGSTLVTGANPDTATYEIAFSTKANVLHALRLEALPDEHLPSGGPGRHPNGNFVLTDVELVVSEETGATTPIAFVHAEADHSQNGYPIGAAIDRDPRSGWAVDGNVRHERRTAVFHLEQPLALEGETHFRLRLRHASQHAHHGIGRFRISIAENAPLADASLWTTTRELDDDDLVHAYVATLSSPPDTYHERRTLRDRLAALERQVPPTMVLGDRKTPRGTFVLERGQYDRQRERVSADVPEVFGSLDAAHGNDRRALADWLVSPDNPLVARVVVNRLWLRCFGRGIVATPDDFGTQGAYPSHPELLDWLALELVSSGWDLRHALRLIVTSQAYRRDSRAEPDLRSRDPENVLLARGPRFRLDAEVLRDLALAASGLLVEEVGGPSVKPVQPPGLWRELSNRTGYSATFVPDEGRRLYRRSLYTYWKRAVPPPSMSTFDAPNREACTVTRSRTNTPLQALVLLHDPQWIEAARHLAWTTLRRHPDSKALDVRLSYVFRCATSRVPDTAELAVLRDLLHGARTTFEVDHDAGLRLLVVGSVATPHDDDVELAAFTEVARACLNVSDFLVLP